MASRPEDQRDDVRRTSQYESSNDSCQSVSEYCGGGFGPDGQCEDEQSRSEYGRDPTSERGQHAVSIGFAFIGDRARREQEEMAREFVLALPMLVGAGLVLFAEATSQRGILGVLALGFLGLVLVIAGIGGLINFALSRRDAKTAKS